MSSKQTKSRNDGERRRDAESPLPPTLKEPRFRLAMAYAADAFALTCRNPSASPSDIARAERVLSDRYAEYGSLILQTRAGVE